MPPMPPPLTALVDNLRRWRNRPERDLSIADEVARLASTARAASRALGGVSLDWHALAPPGAAQSSRPVRLSRGVLVIECDDSATLFALDRWLKSGGSARVLAAAGKASRVRLVASGSGR